MALLTVSGASHGLSVPKPSLEIAGEYFSAFLRIFDLDEFIRLACHGVESRDPGSVLAVA